MSQDEFDIFRAHAASPAPNTVVSAGDPDENELRRLERSLFPEDLNHRPRILIVDDDRSVLEALELALQRDYRPIPCASGDEGLAALEERVAAVILDIKMDRRDGFEIFREIKKRYLHLPIIFHSAYQDLKNPFEIMNEYRPFGYITKGGGSRELLDTLESAVDYYRQIRRNDRLVRRLYSVNRRLETLIHCTREMSHVRDGMAALRVAAAYLRASLPAFSSVQVTGFIHSTGPGDEPAGFVPERLEAPEQEAPSMSPEVSDWLPGLREMQSRGDRFWMPALYEERLLGALAWELNRTPELTREEREFAGALLHSLGLALENVRHVEEQRLAAIGRMASGIVHDLKNHVTVIQGSVELAGDADLTPAKRGEYLELIQGESHRLLEMAYDILDFARGELNLEPAAVALREYLAEVKTSLAALCEGHAVAVDCRCEEDLTVDLDPDRFRRVVFNLAGNAVQAGCRRFELITRRAGECVEFLFSDDGPGIPPEIQDRLFLPFVTHGKSHGTGLGLAMVKHIVEAHGGRIAFESAPGRTTFRIELPAR